MILARQPQETALPVPAERIIRLDRDGEKAGRVGALQWQLRDGLLCITCGDARVQIETEKIGTRVAAPAQGLYIYNGTRPSERRTEQVAALRPAAVWFAGAPAFLRGEAADGGRDLLRTAGIGVYSVRDNGMLWATYNDGWQVETYR